VDFFIFIKYTMAKWINEANGAMKFSGGLVVLIILWLYTKNKLASRSSMVTLIVLSIFSIAIASLLFENVKKRNSYCSWSGKGDDLEASDCKQITQDNTEKHFMIIMIIIFCLVILISLYKLSRGHKAKYNLLNRKRGMSAINKLSYDGSFRAK